MKKKIVFTFSLALIILVLLLAIASCDNSEARPDTSVANEVAQNYTPETVAGNTPTNTPSGTDVVTEFKKSEEDQYCVVQFDSNGGQGFIGDMTLKVGATLALPDKGFTKSLYRFVGFSRTAESTSPEFSLGACYTVTSNEPVTLYAIYEDNSATMQICKNDNDIFGEEQSFLVEKGTEWRLPESPFSKDYHLFCGYSKNPAATSAEYQVGDFVFVTNDLKLYPVWCLQTYKLIIEPQNGETRVAFDLAYGEVTLDERFTSTKIGHSLSGFSTSKDSDDIIYQLNDTVMLERDLVLYAVYEPIPLTVTFITCDDFAIDPIHFRYGESITIPEPQYSVPYYNFAGYSLEGLDSNYIKYSPGQEITPVSDMVLYPIFTLKTVAKRTLTQSVKVTDDGMLAKVDFSEIVDISALYEASYTSYRVTVQWNTSKTKGKCGADMELFRALPKTNYSVFDINGSRPNQFTDAYRILNKNNFSVGKSYSISTAYRSTDELLSETAFYIYYVAAGSNVFDIVNNSYNLTECIITIEFSK